MGALHGCFAARSLDIGECNMSEKNPKDLLKECLENIDENLRKAETNLSYGVKSQALNDIAKARGQIANFLTIMGYL